MNAHDQLLELINGRQEKLTEFNGGILTADKYVRSISECVGSDLCYRYAAKGNISFDDLIKKAAKTLTYNNDEMLMVDNYGKSYQYTNQDGTALELPKNTLMVFKHVLTSPKKDRDGDIMRTQGAKPDPKMLLLWQHVATLPIGKLLRVYEQNAKRLTVISAIVDMNDLSHDSAVMVDNGMGRFSHGFRALEFDKMKDVESGASGGFDVKSFEIMEESLVSIPSNTDAETQEIIVGLAESGKLTSPIMKGVGRIYREKMPVRVAVQKDIAKLNLGLEITVKELGNGQKEHDTGEHKHAEGSSCGCRKSGTPKETDLSVRDEGHTEEKEMKCPKCGGDMVNGKCTKCGYGKGAGGLSLGEIDNLLDNNKAAGAISLNSGAKSHAASLIGSGKVSKSSSWSGPSAEKGNQIIENSGIEAYSKWFLGKHDGADPKTKAAWGYPFTSDFETVDRAGLVAIRQRAGQQDANGIFEAAGALLSKIDGEKETSSEDKGEDENKEKSTKAGRTISAENHKRLNAAHDNIKTVHDTENLVSPGGRALLRESMSHLKCAMGNGTPENPQMTDKRTPEDVATKAASDFLTYSTRDQREKMAEMLSTLCEVDGIKTNTKTFGNLLKGGPGSGPRAGSGRGGFGGSYERTAAHAESVRANGLTQRISSANHESWGHSKNAVEHAKAGNHVEAAKAHRAAADAHRMAARKFTAGSDQHKAHRAAQNAHGMAATRHEMITQYSPGT